MAAAEANTLRYMELISNDPVRLALEIERMAVRVAGVRGAKVEADHSGVKAIRLLLLPESDTEPPVAALCNSVKQEFGIELDPDTFRVLRSTPTSNRPLRRRLGSLMTERVGRTFKTRVTLEVPGDVLIGEQESPVGELLERRAVASAVLGGVDALIDFPVEVESVELMGHGEERVAVVILVRDGDRLVGTAFVRSTDHESIARATLDALNRFIGRSLSATA